MKLKKLANEITWAALGFGIVVVLLWTIGIAARGMASN